MKKIILIILVTFGLNIVSAECGMNGMQFFPKQKDVSLNSMFIIQGYSLSQKTINSFKTRTVYLESDKGELITLNLVEILKGKKSLTQALFKPSKELKPFTTYFLKYSDQTKREGVEMMQYNRDKKENEKVYWRTTNKKKLEALSSKLNIEFEKTEVVYYGCGPSANAIFNVNKETDSEVWYKTEVVEIDTSEKTVYYIKEWKGKLNVGHGMCSGAFTYNRKGKYKVRFTPMNIDGKPIKTTSWKRFESPFVNGKSPLGF